MAADNLEKLGKVSVQVADYTTFEKLPEHLQFSNVTATDVEFFREGSSFIVLMLTDDISTRAIVDNSVIPLIQANNGKLKATYNGIYTGKTGDKYPQFRLGMGL